MAAMPPTLAYRDDVLLCHGSPRDDAAFWLEHVADDGSVRASPIDFIEASADTIDARLILCAHTHVPRVVHLRDGRMIVNPGSVGLPGYDGQAHVPYVVEVGTPHACYAILEHTRQGWCATIRYVPYDTTAMAALARRRGMTTWATAIATGWVERDN
jgi:diadenosine tetraphosphatase ApaH/serine/threonine PP2A family protein phosphatase